MTQDVEARLEALTRRLEALEQENAALRARPAGEQQAAVRTGPVSRRGLLGAAAAGVGALGLTALDVSPAAAATGDPWLLGRNGTSNTCSALTELRSTVVPASGVHASVVTVQAGTASVTSKSTTAALAGWGNRGAFATGVYGFGSSTGVVAEGSTTGLSASGDTGVSASGTTYGVSGDASGPDGGTGVYGSTYNGIGVKADGGYNGTGVVASTGRGLAISASSGTGQGLLVVVEGGSPNPDDQPSEPAAQITSGSTISRCISSELTSSGSTGTSVYAYTAGSGRGVYAVSKKGVGGHFEGARAALRLVPKATTGHPTTGAHDIGEIVLDSAGALYLCTKSGTPGTWKRFTTA